MVVLTLAAVLGFSGDAVFVESFVEVEAFEDEFEGGGGLGVASGAAELFDSGDEAFDLAGDGGMFAGGDHVADLDGNAGSEAVDDGLEFAEVEGPVEDGDDGALDELFDDLVFAAVFDGFEFDFAGEGRDDVGEVADAGDDAVFAGDDGAPESVGEHGFVVGDGGADGDAGALVDVGAPAGEAAYFGDDLFHVLGHGDIEVGGEGVVLRLHDVDFVLDAGGVVGADLGAVAVFEGGDDAAAVGVVLGVGAGDDVDVEGEADAVAPDLDVALFHDVEEADLDALGEVGEFVDAEDAAVGAGDEAVVDGEFVAEVATFGNFDWVDFADEVGDGDVGCGEFFAVAFVAGEPFELGVVAFLGDDVAAGLGDGVEGVFWDFAAGEDGDFVVEECDEGADDAGFGLSALAEEDDVLAGEDGVDDVGDDGFVVAVDSWEKGLAGADFGDEVFPHLFADGEDAVSGGAEFSDGSGAFEGRHWCATPSSLPAIGAGSRRRGGAPGREPVPGHCSGSSVPGTWVNRASGSIIGWALGVSTEGVLADMA